MKCGIVGLPNVGKSTLFNCLSSAKAQAANYPFCTIEPNVGQVTVPDYRLERLSELVNPVRVQPANVEIVDIAGLVRGASKGEGLGNQFLGNIRETNAIIHVLRCFENENVTHVDGSVDPIRDKETIDTELQLKDLDTIEKRLDKAKKMAKSGEKEAKLNVTTLERLIAFVLEGRNVRGFERSEREQELIKEMQLLTDKPVLYLCNVDESAAKSGNAYVDRVVEMAAAEGAGCIHIAVSTESDIAELETYEEKQLFLEELGLEDAGVNRVIRAAYELLNLQTYFTAGVKEVRAWTIKKNFTAPQAAGVIHSDFEKGFIRAEVISFVDYDTLGSENAVKEAGKMRVEGKEYIVQDGDVMHFRFNV
ncbi:MAG: redox-regulated ATPase YchF [Flavobacteriales bacterium]|jgi:ribosome-binding ATPase|nr:redox-regulated ATPase YchF [Flavobacteriales bacterium]MDP4616876.1 redox-regulated ATPase YchF [Schleiferiaceae bacterium]MDP4759098.1 redox-regulated ATPase YchF [Schleiferiaceae bacterium]MDP4768088.1 redox-regulated ATPase YchF [Schleiferiaceae bacterium]MDP4877743.1 redox-regulated ATPase YchF [Schleiferiaceae bacterium]